MSSHVGHTIQKLIHSTPVFASVNDQTTTVVTNGGHVYQAGLIANRIQPTFREIISNPNIVGHVVESASTDNDDYFLSSNGFVFIYEYQTGTCSPTVKEVYSPAVCMGDKAVHIQAGSDHLLILTDHHKVWGVGNNTEYQLVPQGQCRYDVATEMLVTDSIFHDDKSCCKFIGTLNEMRKPHIPKKKCEAVSCVSDDHVIKCVACLEITSATVNGTSGVTINVPVWAEYSYVAFLCVDKDGCVSGNLTLTLYRLFIKCGCHKCESCSNSFDFSVTTELNLFPTLLGQPPRVLTSQISGKCGKDIIVTDLGIIEIPAVTLVNGTLVLTVSETSNTILTTLCGAIISALAGPTVVLDIHIPIHIECCRPCNPPMCEESCLPQPCWQGIYAGSNISVLVDDCNRLYVFGSLHRARNNKDLLKRSCLEDLLSQANASISLPADQLNCCVKRSNENCNCPEKSHKFKTDLSQFRVDLKFDGCEEDCFESDCEKPSNVCDFLKALKHCNDAPTCSNTCYPCDSYIYLNICDHCPKKPIIKCITLLNKRSVCKAVSQHRKDIIRVEVCHDSVVEYDLNRYCIDGADFCLDNVICLDFDQEEGEHVTLFVELEASGGIKFTRDSEKCNVEFPINASCDGQEFLLNYGAVLDPVQLTNLKFYLVQQSIFPCPQFKNPFDTKVTNTYLSPGDRVCFTKSKHCIKHAVTPDLPTVLRLNRRVLDVGVGDNNLSVLVGGLACPNEIYAIGENCYGELGLGTHQSTVCFKQVNRCWFDCQVVAVYGVKHYTLYITQSGKVYGTGKWKGLINSDVPKHIHQVCQAWKIRQIAASSTHIVFVGADGGIFGVGDNSLGELGLCHIDCVPCPHPLFFFHEFSRHIAADAREIFLHPIRRREKYHNAHGGCGCGCDGRGECVQCPPCEPSRPLFELCPSPSRCPEICKPPKCRTPKCEIVRETIKCEQEKCGGRRVQYGREYRPNGRVVIRR